MCFGICIKGINSINFKNYVDFFFEFIAQFVFMAVTFGYMCIAIMIKWVQDWGDGSKAPSIISIFINMGEATKDTVLWGDPMGETQTYLQQLFFKIAFFCVF